MFFWEVFSFSFLRIWIFVCLVILKNKGKMTPLAWKKCWFWFWMLKQLLWISIESFFISHQFNNQNPAHHSYHFSMLNELTVCQTLKMQWLVYIYLPIFRSNVMKNKTFLDKRRQNDADQHNTQRMWTWTYLGLQIARRVTIPLIYFYGFYFQPHYPWSGPITPLNVR